MVAKTQGPLLSEEERILRYGYREIPEKRPDGSVEFRRVALTLEDLLHPQFGDVAVHCSLHSSETIYISSVFSSILVRNESALVFRNCGVFWDDESLRHHSPDISVIFNVRKKRKNWVSFQVAEEGTRPAVIIEVVSPDYRENDVVTKVEHYHRAQVPFYYIVDREHDDDSPRIIGYIWTPQKYVAIAPNQDGRFWIESIGVWLGTENDTVACYNAVTGERFLDYVELVQALAKSRQSVDASERKIVEAKRRRAEAKARLKQLDENPRESHDNL